MKKILSLLAMVSIAIMANAQTKSIELYDLIKLFAPDSAGTGDYVLLQSYTDKQHHVNILINGKPVKPDDDLLLDKISWTANLNPKKTIYSLQAIGFQLAENANPATALFGKAPVQATFLKQCINKEDKKMLTVFNKIKMTGKKPIWIRIETSASYGPYMPMLDITCYTNVKDVKMICNY